IKNREVINLTGIGQTVQNLFKSDAPYGILLANGYQFGFQDGGCLILACAFQKLISSKGIPCELGAVMDVYEGQLRGNHFVCLVGAERSL
ncbi:hypothetical protein, partial [Vibrio vulnificus]|uniref:hypothetical protein n=1 Tax=Vibrio vulnificus TaxID=672 RepID=UPI0039B6CB7F